MKQSLQSIFNFFDKNKQHSENDEQANHNQRLIEAEKSRIELEKHAFARKIETLIQTGELNIVFDLAKDGYKLNYQHIVLLEVAAPSRISEFLSENFEDYQDFFKEFEKKIINFLKLNFEKSTNYEGFYVNLKNNGIQFSVNDAYKSYDFGLIHTLLSNIPQCILFKNNEIDALVAYGNFKTFWSKNLSCLKNPIHKRGIEQETFSNSIPVINQFFESYYLKNKNAILKNVNNQINSFYENFENQAKKSIKQDLVEPIHFTEQQKDLIEKITSTYNELALHQNSIDDFSSYSNIYEKQIPDIIKKYISIPNEYKKELFDKDGLNSEQLCDKNLTEILDIFSAKLSIIKKTMAESSIVDLRAKNGFLKAFKQK